jgi:hypothetical protein
MDEWNRIRHMCMLVACLLTYGTSLCEEGCTVCIGFLHLRRYVGGSGDLIPTESRHLLNAVFTLPLSSFTSFASKGYSVASQTVIHF